MNQMLLSSVFALVLLCKANGQTQNSTTLTSRCLSPNMDIEMTCAVQDSPSLRWSFNDEDTACFRYAFSHTDEYPLALTPDTCDTVLSGLLVSVLSASARGDNFDAVSTLTANLQTLLTLGVESVKCGSASIQSQPIVINSDIQCAASLSLTSQPDISEVFCPGAVNFTCMGAEITTSMSWLVNYTVLTKYTYQDTDETMFISDPVLGNITVEFSASTNPTITSTFDVTSKLRASDVSVFDGISIQCENTESNAASNLIAVQVYDTRLLPPPPPLFNSCSLVPSSEGAEVSIRWSTAFTSQHGVDRYRVSANPDSNLTCSDDSVSPSEEYNCSGLVLGMLYNLEINAINCGDQEGNIYNLVVHPKVPATPVGVALYPVIEDESRLRESILEWTKTEAGEAMCKYDDTTNFVILVENGIEIVIERNVNSSDSCIEDICSVSLSSSEFLANANYSVTIVAVNIFGSSNASTISTFVRLPQLTTVNTVLLIIGVLTWGVALLLTVVYSVLFYRKIVVYYRKNAKVVWPWWQKQHINGEYVLLFSSITKVMIVLLVLDAFLSLLSPVFWLSISLLVGTQEDTSNAEWQHARNSLIIIAFITSLATVLLVSISIIIMIMVYLRKPQIVPKPELKFSIKEDLIGITCTWTNRRHFMDLVLHYDVKCNDVVKTVDEHQFYYDLEPSVLKGKEHCSISVRAISSNGPGDWSESLLIKYKAPPERPQEPSVCAVSLNEISVEVERPPLRDQNGSIVRECRIEYKSAAQDKWNHKSFTFPTDVDSEDFLIDLLKPNMTYDFRIIVINDEGDSEPSDIVSEITDIPSPPRAIEYIMDERTDTTLKFKWQEPAVNAHFVADYRVHVIEHVNSSDTDCEKRINFEQRYVELKGLKPTTTYRVRVQAVNKRGKKGAWSEVCEGTTQARPLVEFTKEMMKSVVNTTFEGGRIGKSMGEAVAPESAIMKAGAAITGATVGLVVSPLIGAKKGFDAVYSYRPQKEEDDVSYDNEYLM